MLNKMLSSACLYPFFWLWSYICLKYFTNIDLEKKKDIRNYGFIINGVFHHTVTSKSRSVDYKQCFNTLSVDGVTNDLYNIGVNDDQLNLIYECDSISKFAVKTPVGLTMRLYLNKLVAQGKVISPLKCTISVDAIAESKVENLSDHLYNYKGRVPIPSCGWLISDYQICVSHCGLDSALATTPQHLDKPQEEGLQFGAQKCLKLQEFVLNFPSEDWGLTSLVKLVDVEGQKQIIEEVDSAKYLADENIRERKNRGYEAVNQICQMLDDLCLGDHFEAVSFGDRKFGWKTIEKSPLCPQ